jgi:hypothetical protein
MVLCALVCKVYERYKLLYVGCAAKSQMATLHLYMFKYRQKTAQLKALTLHFCFCQYSELVKNMCI